MDDKCLLFDRKGYVGYLHRILLHAAIIANVNLMLQLNKDLEAATLPDHKDQLKARIAQIDTRIEPVLIEEDNDPAGFLEEILKTGIEVTM